MPPLGCDKMEHDYRRNDDKRGYSFPQSQDTYDETDTRLKTSSGTTPASQMSRRSMPCVPPQTLAIADMGIPLRLGLGYFYPRGSVGPVCLVEAALEFLAMYTRHVTENVGLKPRFLPGCCPLTNINKLNEATGKQEDTFDLRLGNHP